MYRELGIAVIDKTPEPFKVSKKNKDGVFIGRFSTPAQPDFQGTLRNGRSIVFEAKSTGKDRMTRNVLTATQMELLEIHSQLGAVCGVCANIQNDFFFIPWSIWKDMKYIYGRQYVQPEDVKEYKIRFDGAVHFLDKMLSVEAKELKRMGMGEISNSLKDRSYLKKSIFELKDGCL